jgi:hypothetical protein
MQHLQLVHMSNMSGIITETHSVPLSQFLSETLLHIPCVSRITYVLNFTYLASGLHTSPLSDRKINEMCSLGSQFLIHLLEYTESRHRI